MRSAPQPALRTAFKGATGPRVLVCEDDPDVANLIAIILGNAGYRADVAPDAMAAMRMLSENEYAAMTVDVMLPGKDGLSMIRDLRAGGIAPDLPVVVVSATDCETRGPQLGGVALVDWLTKPIDQPRLLDAVRRGTASHALERPRVLHVDDDHDTHRVVRAIAGSVGEFDHAHDLKSAIALLEKNVYGLVILDLTLPDGCGRDLLPWITARNPAPKVVVFSASDVDGNEASQFAACLLKSTTSNDRLLDVLRAQIGHRHETAEMQP